MTYPDPRAEPVTFQVAHVDLYFFYDIDVVILVMGLFAVGETMYQAWRHGREEFVPVRLRRAYPRPGSVRSVPSSTCPAETALARSLATGAWLRDER